MPGTIDLLDVSYETAEDLSNSQNRVVIISSKGKCSLPTAAGQGKIAGILQNKPGANVDKKIGRAAKVRVEGFSYAIAASAFEIGDALEIADATGKVRKAPVPSATWAGKLVNIVGIAMESSAGDNSKVLIKMDISNYAV